MNRFPTAILLLFSLGLSACVSTEEMKKRQAARAEEAKISEIKTANANAHTTFRTTKNWKSAVFRDDKALALVTDSNISFKVIIAEQRGLFFVKNLIGYDFPLATGKKSHPTPTGDFKIIAKEKIHRSNRYGKIIDSEGNVLEANADSRKHFPGEGERYEGASMPFFMRLTNDGVGMHIGYIPGRPASHGCIRIPKSVAPTLYALSPIGTPVEIVQENELLVPEVKNAPKPASKKAGATKKTEQS